jgi:hypothetical protein
MAMFSVRAPSPRGGWVGLTVGGGGGMVTVAVGNALGAAAILASEADVLGRGVKKRSGEESGTTTNTFERARERSGEGKRRGVGSVRVGAG